MSRPAYPRQIRRRGAIFGGALAVAATILATPSAGAAASPPWTIQPTPNRGTVSELLGVSCPSTTACTAVGSTVSPDVPLAEHWNGSTWAIQSTPSPAGSGDTALESVSCPALDDCIAVGFAQPAGSTRALAERWNGTSWAIQTVPNPAGASLARFASVSCVSTTACTAVGVEATGSDNGGLVERWNGTSWTVQSAPVVAGSALFAGVSCPSLTACTAVGAYDPGSSGLVMLAERWNGSKWTIQSHTNPAGAANSQLVSVSCPTARSCTAVGRYANSALANRFLAEHWNGASWASQTIVDPSHANTNRLYAVSCASASGCTAVGAYGSHGSHLTVAEGWNGSTWSIQQTVNPLPNDYFFGVSCVPIATCTAVGTDSESLTGVYDTLAEHRS
jgi:hypothetical protein